MILVFFGIGTLPVLSATQIISATLAEISGGGDGGGGDTNIGGIIVGGTVGGAAAGASALAFAPLLLAGLERNSVICAAAPLSCIGQRDHYLQRAINCHEGIKSSSNKFYIAQNDCEILNGTYDMDEIRLPEELKSASKLKVNITMASQGYNEVKGESELSLGIYKDITEANLSKKFETQQFLHNYLMKKYDTQMETVYKDYNNGIQKFSGVIDMAKVQNKQIPLQVVARYTEGGFRMNLKRQNPKTITYAYLVELEKIR